jgi:hypothetical protein
MSPGARDKCARPTSTRHRQWVGDYGHDTFTGTNSETRIGTSIEAPEPTDFPNQLTETN